MKNFKSYDITCALTHDLQVCEHCKQCGEYPDVRMEMADYVERLEKALDKACELIDTKYDCPFEEYEYQFKDKRDCYLCDNKSNECWKEYLLKESEKE